MMVIVMILNEDTNVEQFALQFLKGRIIWRDIPKLGITNYGNMISMLLFRQGQFQVELLIAPDNQSSFTEHRHPDVDTVEFGLCGDNELFINGREGHTREQIKLWLADNYKAMPIRIKPTDWHSGIGHTPYAFLSIQKWLNGVSPTSVGLNWEGMYSSEEQAIKNILHIAKSYNEGNKANG